MTNNRNQNQILVSLFVSIVAAVAAASSTAIYELFVHKFILGLIVISAVLGWANGFLQTLFILHIFEKTK